MTDLKETASADGGTLTEVECAECDWTQPPGGSTDHGTPDRPGCADYVDAVMPHISTHIDETGHQVRVTLTTCWLDRDDEQSSMLICPRPVTA